MTFFVSVVGARERSTFEQSGTGCTSISLLATAAIKLLTTGTTTALSNLQFSYSPYY